MLELTQFVKPFEITSEVNFLQKGINVQKVTFPTIALPAHYHDQHLIVVYQSPKVVVERRERTSILKEQFIENDVSLHPAGEYGSVTCINTQQDIMIENLLINIDRLTMTHYAEENFGIINVELKERFLLKDLFIAAASKELIKLHPDNNIASIYQDSLCQSLLYHLIANHSDSRNRITVKELNLSTDVVKRVDEYIMTNIARPIRLEILAEIANLSVFHFARMFKKTTSYAPYQYVLLKKIQVARQLMGLPHATAAETGYKLGFSSPGHFSSFFKKHTGASPSKFKSYLFDSKNL